MMKSKRNYIQPKVEVILVEPENSFYKISDGRDVEKIKPVCNKVSDIKLLEMKILPS